MPNKEKIEYWSFPDIYNKHQNVFESYFETRLSRIKKFFPLIQNIFDVGAGYGFWQKYCKEQGLNSSGIEISHQCCQYAEEKLQLSIECGDVNHFIPHKKYDFIVMCDVLEHVNEPQKTLRYIVDNLMTDEGGIYIQVPDVLGFKIPLNHGLGLPHHLWQFNLTSIQNLLSLSGLEIVTHWTGVQGVIGAYELGGPTLRQRLSWKIANILKIGNRLQIIAKKR